MFDELSRELEFFRKMRALIKQAEVEARLAGSHMGETERLPVAMAAVPFGSSRSRRLRTHEDLRLATGVFPHDRQAAGSLIEHVAQLVQMQGTFLS
jgi:hypothetical protein